MDFVNLIFMFIGMGITEAILKPIAKRWVKRRIISVAPIVLKEIDKRLPELIQLSSGKDLEDQVRKIAEDATGESWKDTDLGPIFTLFDLRKAVEKKQNAVQDPL